MIDNLKAFAAVIDSKSLTKAASRLFLTQSAISRRILITAKLKQIAPRFD